VELLERVIRQHVGIDSRCHLKDERVAATNSARWWGEQPSAVEKFLETGDFGVFYAVRKGSVDDYHNVVDRPLGNKRGNSFLELLQRRDLSALGSNIGSVDY